jgi:hypothetical protein
VRQEQLLAEARWLQAHWVLPVVSSRAQLALLPELAAAVEVGPEERSAVT